MLFLKPNCKPSFHWVAVKQCIYCALTHFGIFSDSTRMHSSRMRTARSLTVSHRKNHAHPPSNYACPPWEQPHMPPGSNHACPPRATTHAPGSNHARSPRATTHAPLGATTCPTPPGATTHAPPGSNHAHPPRATTHAPLEQPCTPPPVDRQTPVKT